jgi:hypothetical protein
VCAGRDRDRSPAIVAMEQADEAIQIDDGAYIDAGI